MLKKIISGGQTGADRAGLIVGKTMGLLTGGWMPKGFKAHDGFHPNFADLYGIVEHSSQHYPPRTRNNVRDSDATVRFAAEFDSAGELLTFDLIKKLGKPYFDVWVLDDRNKPDELVKFIIDHNVSILNVAGNSESRYAGIQSYVVQYLTEVIVKLHELCQCEIRNS